MENTLKLILEKVNAIQTELTDFKAEMNQFRQEVNVRFQTVNDKIDALHDEMTSEFAAVDAEMKSMHELLDERINSIDVVTAQNCKDITYLRAKQA